MASADVALFLNDFLMGFRYLRLWSVAIFVLKVVGLDEIFKLPPVSSSISFASNINLTGLQPTSRCSGSTRVSEGEVVDCMRL